MRRFVLQDGDIVGTDHAGRTVLQLAVDQWTLDQLMVFDADEVEAEDGGDDEPDEALPQSVCWFWEAMAVIDWSGAPFHPGAGAVDCGLDAGPVGARGLRLRDFHHG